MHQRDAGKNLAGTIILDESLEHMVIVYGKCADKWSLPKGHIEENESYMQAALRETREETGLDLQLEVNVLPYITSKRTVLYLVILPMSLTAFNVIDKNEIGYATWYPLIDLPSLKNKNRMLTNMISRLPQIISKLDKNRKNYFWAVRPSACFAEAGSHFSLNCYLKSRILSLLPASEQDIANSIHTEFRGVFEHHELLHAITQLTQHYVAGRAGYGAVGHHTHRHTAHIHTPHTTLHTMPHTTLQASTKAHAHKKVETSEKPQYKTITILKRQDTAVITLPNISSLVLTS